MFCLSLKRRTFEQVVRAIWTSPKAKIRRFVWLIFSFLLSLLCVECANFHFQILTFYSAIALYVFQDIQQSWRVTGDEEQRTLVISERKFFFLFRGNIDGTNGMEYAIGEMWTNLLAVPTFVVVIIHTRRRHRYIFVPRRFCEFL